MEAAALLKALQQRTKEEPDAYKRPMCIGIYPVGPRSKTLSGRQVEEPAHFSAMTPEEIEKVEKIVNDEIAASLPVVTDVMSLDEAKKTGAMALFWREVRRESPCCQDGGFLHRALRRYTRIQHSTIASFKILSEAGIAAASAVSRR